MKQDRMTIVFPLIDSQAKKLVLTYSIACTATAVIMMYDTENKQVQDKIRNFNNS